MVGADELTDIALLKVNAPRPLPFVALGDSKQMKAGDWLIAAGNPFGLGGSVGIGFAIPSDIMVRVGQELREKSRINCGRLGASVQEAPSTGLGIAGVERTGSAAREGLQPGNVVITVDGVKVETARELIRVVGCKLPGAKVTLNVRRQARDVEIPVTFGKRPPTSTANGVED